MTMPNQTDHPFGLPTLRRLLPLAGIVRLVNKKSRPLLIFSA